MSEYDGGPRPLPWPLKNPLVYSRTTEDDTEPPASSFVWPEDSDERVPVIFNLSLNEFVVLASTIDVGSDIAYGVDAIRVWWLWDRMMRENVAICAAIIDCIQNDADVQQALRDFMVAEIGTEGAVQNALSGFIETNPIVADFIQQLASQQAISPFALEDSIFKADECGLGYLFNQTVTTIDVLHTLTQNVFTNLSGGADPLQYAQLFLAIFPLTMNAFNTAFVLGVASAIVGAVRTAYDAQWQEDYIDDLECALFCEVKDDCTMSMNELVTFYARWSGLNITDDVYQSFLDILFMAFNGSYTGKAVPLMHLLMLTAIRLNMNVLGIDFGQYALTVTAAGDVEDNDYLTQCDDCPPEFELVAAIGGPDVLIFQGYDQGDKLYSWYSIYTGNYATGSLYSLDAVPFKVRSIEMEVGEFNPGAYLDCGTGFITDLAEFPLDTPITYIGMYNLNAGNAIRLRVYA